MAQRVRDWLGPFLGCLLFALASGPQAQPRMGVAYFNQATAPTVGIYTGAFWFDTSTDTLKVYTSTAQWAAVGGSGSGTGGLPTGAIVLIDTGACPAGTAEVSGLDGKTLVGTLAANGDVGGTGGSDSITPAGTNGAQTIAWPAGVPTFSGSALGTHSHGFGTIAVAAHTVVATKQGASAGNVVTTGTHSVSGSTASVSAGTPAGTIAWPAGVPTVGVPSFTGTSFDNRSAFTKVIFCKAS